MKVKVTTRSSAGKAAHTYDNPSSWDGDDGHALAILRSGDVKEVVIKFDRTTSLTYRIVQEAA